MSRMKLVGKYPLKNFLMLFPYTYIYNSHIVNYMCVQRTLDIWKSTPPSKFPPLFPHCTRLSQSLIGCLGTWYGNRKVYLGVFPIFSPTSLKTTETMRKRNYASSWCCWLMWNNHFFQLKNFCNLLTCSRLPPAFWLFNC